MRNKRDPIDYQKNQRRKKDVLTGGHLICPGSFFPGRNGITVGGNIIHTIEVRKRNAYHAMCDKCNIQFTLKGFIWNDFITLPKFCGSDRPIPGVSLSEPESIILLKYLAEAKDKAIGEWKDRIWINMENWSQTSLYQSTIPASENTYQSNLGSQLGLHSYDENNQGKEEEE